MSNEEISRFEGEGGLVNDGEIMTPSQVAQFFNVDPKTVQRWARAGKLKSFRTLGGHRRFYRSEIEKARDDVDTDPESAAS